MRILKKISGWLIFIVFGVFLTLFIPSFFVFFVRLLYGFYDGCFTLNGDFCGAVSLVKSRVFDDLFRDFSGNMSSWFAALGTIGAVIVALFQESIKRWFYKPILKLSVKNKEPWCISVPQVDFIEQQEEIAVYPYKLDASNSVTESVSITSGAVSRSKKIKPTANGNALYVGVKVENKGNKTAEHVQVFAKSLKCIEGKFKGKKWHLAMELQWGNAGDSFYPKIHPNTERYCNIGIISEPNSRKHDPRYYYDEILKREKYEESEPALLINVKYPLRKGDHIVGPGRYELEVVVTAAEAKLLRRTVIIEFDKWYDNELEMMKSIKLFLQNKLYCFCYYFSDLERFFRAICSILNPINERCENKKHDPDRMKHLKGM
jgi:hypothetical protein